MLIHEDVTERLLAERQLRASEEQFRTIADAMPQMVWSTLPDADGTSGDGVRTRLWPPTCLGFRDTGLPRVLNLARFYNMGTNYSRLFSGAAAKRGPPRDGAGYDPAGR